MSKGNPNARWNIDPSAGVLRAPKMLECPRCGIEKGPRGPARPGLCRDCRDVLPAADRAEWRRAA